SLPARAHYPANHIELGRASWPSEWFRSASPFAERTSAQSSEQVAGCLPGVRAMAECESEKHSTDSRGRCEIHGLKSSPLNRDSLPRSSAHLLFSCACCPGARIRVPAKRARALVEFPAGRLLPRREIGCPGPRVPAVPSSD